MFTKLFNAVFGRRSSVVKPAMRRKTIGRVEKLEDRSLMAADAFVLIDNQFDEVLRGPGVVDLAAFTMIGVGNQPTSITFNAQPTATLTAAIDYRLQADLFNANREFKPDGLPDTVISNGALSADSLTVSFGTAPLGQFMLEHGTKLWVDAIVKDGVIDETLIGLSNPVITFADASPPTVHYIGAERNSLNRVDLPASLTVSGKGQFGGPIGIGMQNVHMLNVDLESKNGAVDALEFYFTFEIVSADGAEAPYFAEDLIDTAELFNITTGETVDADLVYQDFGYGVYLATDFTVSGLEHWRIRADMLTEISEEEMEGLQVRTHVVATDRGVTIPGIGYTTLLPIHFHEVEDSDHVSLFLPNDLVSSEFATIGSPKFYVNDLTSLPTDIAVANQKKITLARGQFGANQIEDLLFTELVYAKAAGNLANIQNASLWVDLDGDTRVDTILQAGVIGASDQLVFNALTGGGVVVAAGDSMNFEIRADVSSSLQADPRLQLKLFSAKAETVESGEDVVNGSTGTPQPQTVWSFVRSGDLFVTKDVNVPRSHQILAGTTLSDPILVLNFRAQNEDIDVTQITISLKGVNLKSVDRFEFFKFGETTPFATSSLAAVQPRASEFTSYSVNLALGQLIIPEGTDNDVLVRLRAKNDVQGAVSGETIQAAVLANYGGIKARGYTSTNVLAKNDGDTLPEGEVQIGTDVAGPNKPVNGNYNQVVLSSIRSITNADPNADGTNVPIGLQPLGQFRFQAATNNNSNNGLNLAAINAIIFTVDAENALLFTSGFSIYNKADSSQKLRVYPLDMEGRPINAPTLTGKFLVKVTGLVGSRVNTILQSGTSNVLVLEGIVVNPQVNTAIGSGLVVSIEKFSRPSPFGPLGSHFQWHDRDTADGETYNWVESDLTVIRSAQYRNIASTVTKTASFSATDAVFLSLIEDPKKKK